MVIRRFFQITLFFAIILSAGSCLYSQDTDTDTKPNFAGIWVYESGNSNFNGQSLGKAESPEGTRDEQLMIEQNLPKIVVRQRLILTYHAKGKNEKMLDVDQTFTHYLDGREEFNTSFDGVKVYSFTEWKGAKLKTTYYSAPKSEKKRKAIGTAEMELSKDGKVLTVSRHSLNSDADTPMVFGVNDRRDKYHLKQ